MENKLKRAYQRSRSKLLVSIILWVILTIVFVCPLAIAIKDASNSDNSFEVFIETIGVQIMRPVISLGTGLSSEYIDTFLGVFLTFTIFYFVIMVIGILRALPKHEYDYIEHGSSDWCENGEQYKILSKNKGIILAEKHYLPLNKLGNVNVLAVGRFRFW